jgi:ribA/ribD-fused uncharacterized protein
MVETNIFNLNPEKRIDMFDGTDFDFLSNFHSSPIEFHCMKFPTVEHAFQAAKMASQADYLKVARAETPGEAKRLGRTLPMRSDWDIIKFDIMYQLVKAKFEQNPRLASKLLETKKAELVEGTWWNDRIWGIDNYTGIGQNNLGKILMKVREELKNNLKNI